jgi:hypothetical protein
MFMLMMAAVAYAPVTGNKTRSEATTRKQEPREKSMEGSAANLESAVNDDSETAETETATAGGERDQRPAFCGCCSSAMDEQAPTKRGRDGDCGE